MDEGAGPDSRLAATIFLGTGRAEGALAVDTSDPAVRATNATWSPRGDQTRRVA